MGVEIEIVDVEAPFEDRVGAARIDGEIALRVDGVEGDLRVGEIALGARDIELAGDLERTEPAARRRQRAARPSRELTQRRDVEGGLAVELEHVSRCDIALEVEFGGGPRRPPPPRRPLARKDSPR